MKPALILWFLLIRPALAQDTEPSTVDQESVDALAQEILDLSVQDFLALRDVLAQEFGITTEAEQTENTEQAAASEVSSSASGLAPAGDYQILLVDVGSDRDAVEEVLLRHSMPSEDVRAALRSPPHVLKEGVQIRTAAGYALELAIAGASSQITQESDPSITELITPDDLHTRSK